MKPITIVPIDHSKALLIKIHVADGKFSDGREFSICNGVNGDIIITFNNKQWSVGLRDVLTQILPLMDGDSQDRNFIPAGEA